MCINNFIWVFIAAIFATLGLTVFSVESEPARPEESVGISEIGEAVISSDFIIENVPSHGGLEVYSFPDRATGREFAASDAFQPHVAGINAERDWLYIYYFDQGELRDGWSPVSQLVLTDEEIADLPFIDPENPPELPDLEFNSLAARPYGSTSVNATSIPDGEPTATPENGTGGGNPEPTPGSIPSTNQPPPDIDD